MKMLRSLLTITLTLLSASLVHAAPGDLDPLDANLGGSFVAASAVQPDGKILISGMFTLGAWRAAQQYRAA